MKRTAFLRLLALGGLGLTAMWGATPPLVEVWKTRTCGCCGKWVEHLKASGFEVKVTDVPSTAEYRKKYGVPESLMSCHTALVKGIAVEGHVPAEDIHKLLKSGLASGRIGGRKGGLAVPGMPIGSPGMEQGSRRDAYSVVFFDSTGKTSEFRKISAVQ